MLAQGRVRELNKDLPIIAAAATTPTAASMKGLDAKTQRVVFMLLSQAFEDRRFRRFQICLRGRQRRRFDLRTKVRCMQSENHTGSSRANNPVLLKL